MDAKDPAAAAFDGGPPRELLRWQPFQNHNGGHISSAAGGIRGRRFRPAVHVGCADGGSGNDPFNVAQDLSSAFNKILESIRSARTTRTANKIRRRTHSSVWQGRTLGEIYAWVRNPQRFSGIRDPPDVLLHIGQSLIRDRSGDGGRKPRMERLKPAISSTAAASAPRTRSGRDHIPVVEYGHIDPLFHGSAAIIGGAVYRQGTVGPLKDLMIFGDNPSGEVFYVQADKLPQGGQDAIRRILFNQNGEAKTLLELVQDKNTKQGKQPAPQALHLDTGQRAAVRAEQARRRDSATRREWVGSYQLSALG
jgi:hypothetical protein